MPEAWHPPRLLSRECQQCIPECAFRKGGLSHWHPWVGCADGGRVFSSRAFLASTSLISRRVFAWEAVCAATGALGGVGALIANAASALHGGRVPSRGTDETRRARSGGELATVADEAARTPFAGGVGATSAVRAATAG